MAGSRDNFSKAMNLGHSAAWDQQWDQAAKAYQVALEEFPEDPKALVSLGLALFEMHHFDESLLAYQKALKASPDDPLPSEKVARLSARLGRTSDAIQYAMKAADQYIRRQEVKKAIECWVQVTQWNPAEITAHMYLAMVHERLGHKLQAIREFLVVASLYQQGGNQEKAEEMIERAIHIDPTSVEGRQALHMLKTGLPLPKPLHSIGNTDTLRPKEIKESAPKEPSPTGLTPIDEANKNALARLAEILFNMPDAMENRVSSAADISSIVKGTSTVVYKQSGQSRIILLIGQAIEHQTDGQEEVAIGELEKAIAAGLKDQSAYYNLGYLLLKYGQPEKALRNLQVAVKNNTYTLASRLLMGRIEQELGHPRNAAVEYLEALKMADSLCVPPDQAADLRQSYEPYIEAQSQVEDPKAHMKVSKNIESLLSHPDWRMRTLQAREQIPEQEEGMPPLPLAEILLHAQDSQVLEAIGRIHQLVKAEYLRSAMEEAYAALVKAPYYLPLHLLIGDLLHKQGYAQEAMEKYNIVAEAYSARGEASQAVAFLRRVIKTSPMDMKARARLIDHLVAQGSMDDAVREFLDLGDLYYRLAELDQARKTYTKALNLARQGGANRAWFVKLLQRMADIDMQRLDWPQALGVYKQIRNLTPADGKIRRDLIQLNLRLDQSREAAEELASFLAFLQGNGRQQEIIPFLEDLVKEDPQQILPRRVLAEQYQRSGKINETAVQLAETGEILFETGKKEEARKVIETLISMNPSNLGQFTSLVKKIQDTE